MARKMKTMDGNNAAAYVSLCVYRGCGHLPDHPVQPDGRLCRSVVCCRTEKHFWHRPLRLLKCSPKQALPVRFTARWLPAP